jgi:type III secretory pathway component EscT
MEALTNGQLMQLAVMVLGTAAGPYAFLRLFAPFESVQNNRALLGSMAVAFALPFVPDQILQLQQGESALGGKSLLLDLVHILGGITLAVALSLPLKIITSIGQLIDNQRGLSINGPQNPIVKDPTTSLENLTAMIINIVIFYYDFHIDAFSAFYQAMFYLDPPHFLQSMTTDTGRWAAELADYKSILFRILPLIALLLAIDIANALAVRRLQSGDLGGIQNVLKNVVTCFWLLIMLRLLLDPARIELFRQEFVELARNVFNIP